MPTRLKTRFCRGQSKCVEQSAERHSNVGQISTFHSRLKPTCSQFHTVTDKRLPSPLFTWILPQCRCVTKFGLTIFKNGHTSLRCRILSTIMLLFICNASFERHINTYFSDKISMRMGIECWGRNIVAMEYSNRQFHTTTTRHYQRTWNQQEWQDLVVAGQLQTRFITAGRHSSQAEVGSHNYWCSRFRVPAWSWHQLWSQSRPTHLESRGTLLLPTQPTSADTMGENNGARREGCTPPPEIGLGMQIQLSPQIMPELLYNLTTNYSVLDKTSNHKQLSRQSNPHDLVPPCWLLPNLRTSLAFQTRSAPLADTSHNVRRLSPFCRRCAIQIYARATEHWHWHLRQ